MASLMPTVTLYGADSYTFGTDSAAAAAAATTSAGAGAAGADSGESGPGSKAAGDASTESARVAEFKERFERDGLQREVRAVMLVHGHHHPHVLMCKNTKEDGAQRWSLPGGVLSAGASESRGMAQLLREQLGRGAGEWEVGEVLATWHRATYGEALFPYALPHVSRPKGAVKLFLCRLPAKCAFAVAAPHVRLVAVPLLELYDRKDDYGPVVASLPACLSRFQFNYVDA